MLVTPSLGNRDITDARILPQLMNLFFVLVMVFVTMLFKKFQKRVEIDCDQKEVTPADYTLYAQNFPKNVKISEIIEYVKDVAKEERAVNIKKIIPAYFIGEYIRLLRKKRKLIEIAHKLSLGKKVRGWTQESLDEDLTQVYLSIAEFEDECSTNLESKFTGCVFIVFDTEEGDYLLNSKVLYVLFLMKMQGQ